MKITQFFGKNSRNAQYMRYDYEHAHGSIFDRYNSPSTAKVNTYFEIIDIYESNNGVQGIFIKGKPDYFEYQHDIKIAGASSHFYSTIASFKRLSDGKLFLIKETHANTYMCEL